jgi:hypothetical protein
MNINTRQYIEEYIKIRDKAGAIIDFKLNEPQQRLYDIIKEQRELKKPVRIIILKARQMGFSTLTESILFKETATKFNINTGIIAHKEEATTNLFNMSKRIYSNLPEDMKPALRNSNAKELIFDNYEGTGLKSKIKCMTAGADGVGRSDTFNNLHISELAFWTGDKKATMTGLLQAVPNLPNTMIIIESTANGFEYYQELWQMAVNGESDFIPLFVGWNELEEYKMAYTGFSLTEEEKKLQELYNLSLEQLTWRRWCINNNCGGDIEQFKQEYPINPQEAFLSTGNCIFNKEKIIERMQRLPVPITRGYFEYNIEEAAKGKMIDIKFIPDKKGCITIYKKPNLSKYVIGGDTAGDTLGDEFSVDVIDAKTMEQVASLEMQTDEDLYAKQVYCLGYCYHSKSITGEIQPALVAIETNFSTYPQKELERLGYTNFYIREVFDNYSKSTTKQFGFLTNKKTKPIILSNLVQLVREDVNIFNHKKTLDQMITMVKKENGKQEAEQGFHDDKVMSVAIAYHAVGQVLFDKEPKEPEKNFLDNWYKKEVYQEDYGEEIEVI